MALTPKSTPLKGAGGYTTTTPTKKGGAGVLKPFGAGRQSVRNAGTPVNNRIFQGGKRGVNAATSAQLKNKPRVIVP